LDFQQTLDEQSLMPKVSVVIAVYNGERFVAEAIGSVQAQTFVDFEIIVVNDGSTDRTLEVVEQFESDSRLTVVSQENMGQAHAKNTGAMHGTGEFIAFLDADDFWRADKLARQIPEFKDRAVDVVYSGVTTVDEFSAVCNWQEEDIDRPSGHVTERLFITNFVPFASAVVRRTAFARAEGFDESLKMGIDWHLWLRLSLESKFKFVDEKLLFYRLWDGQMSSDIIGRYDGAFRIMEQFLAENEGAVSERVQKIAYADSYARRASYRSRLLNDTKGGLADCMAAFSYTMRYPYAWKVLLLVLVRPLLGKVAGQY
jgi:glycosyltransferase involved in cell wall biosynthesis